MNLIINSIKITVIGLLSIFLNQAQAQEKDSTKLPLSYFQKVIRVNRPLSYITISQGIGNLDPLLFEAQVSPSFFVSTKRGSWALQVTPHIILRMKNERSYPIKNPSYILPINIHHRLGFWQKSFLNKLLYEKAYATVGFHHHSNGQSGKFFKRDGSLNIEGGSFSTNYVSFALTTYRHNADHNPAGVSLFQLYYERHLPGLSFEEATFSKALFDIYGLDRVYLQYSNLNLSRKNGVVSTKLLSNSRIISKAGWIFGPIQASEVKIHKRLLLSFRYIYYPNWMDEIAFFSEYYQGQDYYNMQFEKHLSVFRIGLISDPLSIWQTDGSIFN